MTLPRIAVVGAGHLGRFHAKLSAGIDQLDLVAVADPSESHRTAVAAEASTRPVADYRELIGQIDAAVVATPTVLHFEIVKQLLDAGVHVLCEKPLTPTLGEANELVAAADASGAVLQVGHVERFNPAVGLAAPRLRDPRLIRTTRTSGYTFRSTDIGAVLDLMIHDIDLVLSLVHSPVVSVQAMGLSVLGDNEDMVTAQLTFENGCVAQLNASRVSFQLERTMQAYTSHGYVGVDFNTRQATFVEPREDVLRRGFHVGSLTGDEKDHLKANLFDELLVKTTEEAPPINAIEEELKDFAHAITTGSAPRVTGADGRDAVGVAEQILQKVEEHRWDGNAEGRHGAFATPAMPVLPIETPIRRAA
ncbi:Dehydrogenase [Posidoniimonas corsicana]|uniref:Dehydrogenase n=1 Tax=Posidoniimonas corsicana TaxID=1938618 RepID=A0A5C5VCE6_9BACT|nr:Gfo/Idh/MocA family oxidoreductase [Posidoniimonas corsicana]TWT36248.1 Dehydrogenase [Posidoniimonas corsicana]